MADATAITLKKNPSGARVTEPPDQEIETLESIYWSKRDPDGLAFAALAAAHLRRGGIREALTLLHDGTARHPEYATGHVMLTRLYFEQGMSGEAEFAARRVLELDAENLVGLSLLSRLLSERGDAEAQVLRDRLVSVDPDSDEAMAVATASKPRPADFFADPWGPPDADEVFEGRGDSDAEESGEESAADPVVDVMAGTGTLAELTIREDLGIIESLGDMAAEPATIEVPVVPVRVDDPAVSGTPDDEASWGLMLSRDAFGVPSEVPEDAIGLAALAPDREPDAADVVDLAALAPDREPDAADVVDLAALAPDREPDAAEAVDLAALAPDREPDAAELVDLTALAPDVEHDEVEAVDLAGLAPDTKPEEETIDMTALAPDDEPEGVEAIDLAALAPDDGPGRTEAIDLAALAPDDDEPDWAEAVDLAALAPDDEGEETEAIELAALAPDDGSGESEEVEAIELAALASGDEPHDTEDLDLAAAAPESGSEETEQATDPADPPTGRATADHHAEASDEPLRTRTLAELYVTQGFVGQAVAVYRHLLDEDPEADDVRRRIEELTGAESASDAGETASADRSAPVAMAAGDPMEVEQPVEDREDDGLRAADVAGADAAEEVPRSRAGGHHDEDLEEQARDLAGFGNSRHDFDSPFAWHQEDTVVGSDEPGPDIGTYFDALLSWTSERE